MPGTTAAIVAINAANTANSSAAAARAHQAQVTACQALTKDFHGDTATIEQRQSYAECVQVLYPQEMGADSVLFIKAMIVAAILGVIVGAFREVRAGYEPFGDALFGGIKGVIVGPVSVIAVAALWAGIQYLAT